MLSDQTVYIGVDTTSAHKAFTYAALDRELNVLSLSEADPDELLLSLADQQAATVAINSPSHLNAGLVRKRLQPEGDPQRHIRNAELRLAEHDLRERGILVGGTASRESLCSAWVRIGFELYRRLGEIGYEPYPADGCSRLVLENSSHAAYCVLLGRVPLAKPSWEGRIQRQLVLYENGVRIPDPMLFFEEITRHKLISGIMPLDLLYPGEQLDALVAAYTAWLSTHKPGSLTRLGSAEEGYLHVPTADLKEKYQA